MKAANEDQIVAALDALRSASLWFTMDALDSDDCDFWNSGACERMKKTARAKIDAAIDALTTRPAKASRGGRKGGLARAATLSPGRRQEIAKQAANTRWGTS